jgi:hypothetical protein
VLPKSINIQNTMYDFYEIKAILYSIYPSILSFSHIRVTLKSEIKFEELLILSNLAKSIDLDMVNAEKKWEVKEFPLNY